jgi:hypothetical protein
VTATPASPSASPSPEAPGCGLCRRHRRHAPGHARIGAGPKFSGSLQPGVTLRDVVNAIPWVAIQQGLLTVEKANKKNIFNGRIMEIEGLPDLKLEQAFELTDATAERSCAGCTIKLSEATVSEYLRSNVALLKNMIARGYSDARTLARRIKVMEDWLANPQLLEADADAEYAEVIEINLDELTEPVLACPNDPDNVKLLSEVAGEAVQEVFIGSCMTNIGHYRAAAKVLEEAGATSLPGSGFARPRVWTRTCSSKRATTPHLSSRQPHGNARLLALHGQSSPGRVTTPPCSPPAPATSTTAWAKERRCIWAAPSWLRSAPSSGRIPHQG